jgi:outer membrane protein TolC
MRIARPRQRPIHESVPPIHPATDRDVTVDGGVVSGGDVAQAQTQLEMTRAQATDLGVARAELEHAIAILAGKPPADLTVAHSATEVAPPAIPLALPSELVERRPDVAAAERRVAAANAQIGVAKAAFFPTLAL